MSQELTAVGYDATAYSRRVKGYSPGEIREAIWALVGGQIKGAVLEAGPGEGGWAMRLRQCPHVERVLCVDIVDSGASRVEGVDFVTADLSTAPIPSPGESLDWAFAVELLEHLANPRHFVTEVSRCLKPGGKLVITTPCNESLTAKLSFMFRGYFPAFCDHDYGASGHITPITEVDLRRMSKEAGFGTAEFFYPLGGRMPKTAINWQRVFPTLRGKLWSDTLFAVLTR